MKTLLVSAAAAGIALMILGPPANNRFALDDDSPDRGASVATAPPPIYSGPAAAVSDESLNAVVKFYCTTCHNAVTLRGNMSLEGFDISKITENSVLGEKMIRKLRAGMMPPMPMPRPAPDTLLALVETIETRLDKAASGHAPIGNRPFQRLNRPEYEAAIKDLLALDVTAGDWLPLDTKDANFDNIAEAQLASTLLIESYLNAAGEISRMAVGDGNAAPVWRTYTQLDYVSQHPWDHVEGTPYGTRGGIVEEHVFPTDGYYYFEMTVSRGNTRTEEDIVLSIDGARTALLQFEAGVQSTVKAPDGRAPQGLRTEPIFVRAGQHHVATAFVRKAEGPYEDLIKPHEWALAGGTGGTAAATHIPHLTSLTIGGPFESTGISDSPSRQKVFSCRPTGPETVRPCATSIVERLAGEAFRRPATAEELTGLLAFYDTGAEKGGFEGGVRMALEAILAHPSFYFRLERTDNSTQDRPYRISDADLATRLAFFLWGATPDQELTDLAARGKLSDRKVLEQQTIRMLKDPRAEALSTRFAAQWLRLQDLIKVRADPNFFPNYDENLAEAMRRETELFFNDLVVNDQSVMKLFSADYTFVNERLARHYGFSNVAGNHFRRVEYPDDRRTGLFGQGSVLVLTSLAGRTSPVLRGKWVMEVLLGTPPPPPPPNVPTLAETPGVAAGKILTTRERMEQHRNNELCRSCHMFMDPIGLALDNFDVTGKWRFREGGMPLDTRGMLYDGTEISSPRQLADALLKRPIPLARNFTENLLTYALGRRLDPSYGPLVRQIAREAEANDYKVSSFVLAIVKSDAFQMRDASVATQSEGSRN